jgi:cytochrome c553
VIIKETLSMSRTDKPKARLTKLIGVRLAPVAIILAIVPYAADRAECASGARSALQAKIEYCNTCHGLSAQGYHGFYPIPRLAGQQTQYIENQLRAFIERRRKNSYMYSVAHVLSPTMQVALAGYFSGLSAKPLEGGAGSRAATSEGQRIFEDGDPATNVPACTACHGVGAKGHDEIPRLAGQLPDYIYNKLVNWNRERGQDPRHPDISAIMLPTSHNLTKSQIRAVATYVSHLQ